MQFLGFTVTLFVLLTNPFVFIHFAAQKNILKKSNINAERIVKSIISVRDYDGYHKYPISFEYNVFN